MAGKNSGTKQDLEAISKGDFRIGEQLIRMTEKSYEESGLDPETFMLIRVATLASVDAAPASWLVNLKIGKELGIDPDKAVGTLVAIAPIIGTARVVSAAGSILKALAMAESLNKS